VSRHGIYLDHRLRLRRLQNLVLIGASQVSGQTLAGFHGDISRFPCHLPVDRLPDTPTPKVDYLSCDFGGHPLLDSTLDV
jgi:hypothetical protein